jgi:hypothetical protein
MHIYTHAYRAPMRTAAAAAATSPGAWCTTGHGGMSSTRFGSGYSLNHGCRRASRGCGGRQSPANTRHPSTVNRQPSNVTSQQTKRRRRKKEIPPRGVDHTVRRSSGSYVRKPSSRSRPCTRPRTAGSGVRRRNRGREGVERGWRQQGVGPVDAVCMLRGRAARRQRRRRTCGDRCGNRVCIVPLLYGAREKGSVAKPGSAVTSGHAPCDGSPSSAKIFCSCSTSVAPGSSGSRTSSSPKMQPTALSHRWGRDGRNETQGCARQRTVRE